MIYSVRKDNETFESLFRRFQKRIQSSGRVKSIKKIRFMVSPLSKNLANKRSVKKREIAARRDYLIKAGKLPSDEIR